jgi:hypothetical protein
MLSEFGGWLKERDANLVIAEDLADEIRKAAFDRVPDRLAEFVADIHARALEPAELAA